MNRKQYITTLIAFAIIAIAGIITNAIFEYASWILIFTFVFVGYLYVKYRVDGSLQTFSTKFNMLLDYDLEVDAALEMAQKAYDNAPTNALKATYLLYVGMAHYYCGHYQEAILSFNQIDLAKMNPVFHALVFAFTAYSAFEINDQETFDLCVERIGALINQVPAKYKNFVSNYEEVLVATQNMETSIDNYKDMVEKHFANDDGYIARKLNYQYRLSYYYKAIGDTLEMDKCLAFCIANGKEQHIAKRAKALFQGSVNVEDYIYDPTAATIVSEDLVENIELLEELEPVEETEENKEE